MNEFWTLPILPISTILLGELIALSLIGWFRLARWPALLLSALPLTSLVAWANAPWLTPNTVLWVIALWASLSLPLSIPALRQRWISQALMRHYKRIAPTISATERAALEAGSVGWEAELFSGHPNWQRLWQTPKPTLSPEEQAFLEGPTNELCALIDDWDITHRRLDLPPEVWAHLRQHRFFAMIIPKRYGGLEFSAYAHSCVVMKIASRSISAAVTVMVPNSLGPAKLLLHYGTDAQKNRYLPGLAQGKDIPCFALTNPQAGSDASAIPDRGIVCYGSHQGQQVLGIRLSWDKRYITLAPVATLLGLAFHLYDPDHLIGDRDDIGISVALLPSDHPGVEIGERHFPLNAAFQNGPTRGREVFIPMDYLIGGQAMAGRGWAMLMEQLADGRGISLPALATGAGKFASASSGAYARIREQFHLPIGRFEGIEEALAKIAVETTIMDAGRQLTCAALDQGEHPAIITAMVKYQLTERMRQALNAAMDIHGGRGICMGPRNYLARAYQAVPIAITVEGANILTRSLIVFGQGALRAHPWLLQELQATQNNDLKAFDSAVFGHARELIGNLTRAFLLGLRYGKPPHRLHPSESDWIHQLERYSAAFALTADAALFLLGPNLKRREKITGRLADILSQLFLASALIKQQRDQAHANDALAVTNSALASLCYDIQHQLINITRNLPHPLVARSLARLLFPRGLRALEPADELSHQIAADMIRPSRLRQRLSHGIYQSRDPQDITGRLESAFNKIIDAEASYRVLRDAQRQGKLTAKNPQAFGLEEQIQQAQAQGLLDQMQAARLRSAEAARADAIAVDAFSPQALAQNQSQHHRKPA